MRETCRTAWFCVVIVHKCEVCVGSVQECEVWGGDWQLGLTTCIGVERVSTNNLLLEAWCRFTEYSLEVMRVSVEWL